ncbi:MAG: sulfotransferase family protein, partial [Candidatus Heimdallarchaeota archaeon]
SMPETRPMDDVVMGADEPTEEEYAIGATDKYGFYNGFIFPKNFELYSKYNSFDQCEPKDFERWQKRYDFFIKKMTYKYEGKMLFLKNPANTYRIPTLLKMYPNAKFVHIYRNPYDMYASTLKFYRGVFAIYALQTWKDEDLQQGVLDNFAEMYVKFNEDRNLIPKENLIEIQYEDFIKDPIKHVKKIYKDLRIDGFDEYKGIFEKYIKSQATYKPNVHKISDDIIERVNTHWDFVRDQHGYEKLEPESSK